LADLLGVELHAVIGGEARELVDEHYQGGKCWILGRRQLPSWLRLKSAKTIIEFLQSVVATKRGGL